MSSVPDTPVPRLRSGFKIVFVVLVLAVLPFVFREFGRPMKRWFRSLIVPSGAEPKHAVKADTQPKTESAKTSKLADQFTEMRWFLVEMCEQDEHGKWRRTPDIRQPPPTSTRSIAGSGTDGGGAVTNVVGRRIWNLSIDGITYDGKGACVAMCRKWRLAKGTRVRMEEAPDGRCGYRILAVSPHNVWAWVILTSAEAGAKKDPSMQWPDFTAVHFNSKGMARIPAGLKLSDGRVLDVGRSAVYPSSGARLKLLRVWPQGGEFSLIYSTGEEECRLVCVLPGNNP